MLIHKTYKHLLKLLKQPEYHVEKYKYKMYQQEPHTYYYHHRRHPHHSSLTVLGVMSVMLLTALLPLKCVEAVGYSYTRFTGPVTGPEEKVYVNDVTHRNPHYKGSVSTRLDYVAKPEYEFSYGVEDADAHVLHNRNEVRDGDAVKGVYSLIDPDGALRVVKYTADETNGFQAEVIRNGISSLHGQLKNENEFAEQNPKLIRNNNKYYSKGDKDEQQQHYAPALSSSLHSLPKWDQQPQKYPQPSLLSQYNPTKPEKWSSPSSSAQYNRPKIEQQQQQHLPQPLSTAQYNRPKVEKWPSSAQYNAPSVSTQYNPLKFKQWQQVSHQRPYNQFKQQTPSTTVRNYNDYNNNNYNKINIDDGTDNGNDEDDEADEDEQPHYEVHEKPKHDEDDDDDHESEQEEDDKEDDEDVGDNEKYQQQQLQQPQHHFQLPSSLLQYNPAKWEQHYSQSPPISSLYKPSIIVQPQYKPQYNPTKLQQWQQINQHPSYPDQYNHYQQTTPAPLITYSDYNFNNYNQNNTDDKYNADDKANIDDVDGITGQYANDNDVGISEEPQSQTEVNKPGKDIVVIITNKKKKKPFSKKDGTKDDDDDDSDDEDDSSDEDDDDSDEFEEYDEAVRKPHSGEYY